MVGGGGGPWESSVFVGGKMKSDERVMSQKKQPRLGTFEKN